MARWVRVLPILRAAGEILSGQGSPNEPSLRLVVALEAAGGLPSPPEDGAAILATARNVADALRKAVWSALDTSRCPRIGADQPFEAHALWAIHLEYGLTVRS